ncbi:MAG: ribose-5-phosphate isomerase RpiA [Pseudomonadota bacterium]
MTGTAGKRAAAAAAVALVEDGMTLGLGTGSTAAIFVDLLAERIAADGIGVLGVPTSVVTAGQAGSLGIPLTTLDAVDRLDLTVDGADEVDGSLTLIKGGGGALLCEKIVAAASDRMVVIADPSKKVDTLGNFALPVEIVRFGAAATERRVAACLERQDVGARRMSRRRNQGGVFVTDEGHEIVDLSLERIGDAEALHAALLDLPGVVETGLFIGIADTVLIGRDDGQVDRYDR